MNERIYLDYAATTPVDARVLNSMMPYFSETFGNPSSVHYFGQRAEAALGSAREKIAEALNSRPEEIVFTSGGSESDNLALRGACLASRSRKGEAWILTSRAEHHAVTKTVEQLAGQSGYRLAWLDVDQHGMIHPETVEAALSDGTILVSVMYANNEIGTINPVKEIAQVCHRHGVLLHTDAVQAAAYLPVDVEELGIDLLSIGAHKFYGPKGVGALFVRTGTPLVPVQTGGGQESGLRSGTENVAYIAGMAEALRLTEAQREQHAAHVRPLRDRIIGTILEEIPSSRLTGHPSQRLPNHASFAFEGVDGNLLLTLLDADGFACSSGSACKTGNPEPSEVMAAIGLPREWGLGSLRVTLGVGTTAEQVEKFLAALPGLVAKAKKLSSQR